MSFGPDLGAAVRAAARRSDQGLSGWLADAAKASADLALAAPVTPESVG
jgi:hypothetical protein